jgi:hypothetical protein
MSMIREGSIGVVEDAASSESGGKQVERAINLLQSEEEFGDIYPLSFLAGYCDGPSG